jgi:RND superfamily putative drug exporter
VLRRPVSVLVASVIGLGALAVPAASLKLGLPDEGAMPAASTQRKAYDLISEGFGPGVNGPLTVPAAATTPTRRHGRSGPRCEAWTVWPP